MNENKSYAELKFSNPILIDILSRHISNTVLAEIIDSDGVFNIRLEADETAEPPKVCEDVIIFLYKLFEKNGSSAIGKAYAENKSAIIEETFFSLGKLNEGFTRVDITLDITKKSEENPSATVNTKTVFTLNRTKTVEENKTERSEN